MKYAGVGYSLFTKSYLDWITILFVASDLSAPLQEHIQCVYGLKQCFSHLIVPSPYMREKRLLLLDNE